MKILMLSSLLFISSHLLFAADAKKKSVRESFKIDTKASVVNWIGQKKILKDHKGTLKFKSGAFQLSGKKLLKGAIFIVDMKTLDNTDLKGDPEMHKKLVDHLKDPDFFDVQNHPEARLEILDAQFGKGGRYNVTALLTIKKVSEKIQFEADVIRQKEDVRVKAEVKFDRTKFGITYNSPNLAKKVADRYLIKNEVVLDIDILAKN